jgi:hypothetical protein
LAAQGITLVVSEGAEAQGSVSEVGDRYQEFSKRISITLKRPVTLAPTTQLPALQQALAEIRADLAWIRPVNIAADAIATRGYVLSRPRKASSIRHSSSQEFDAQDDQNSRKTGDAPRQERLSTGWASRNCATST